MKKFVKTGKLKGKMLAKILIKVNKEITTFDFLLHTYIKTENYVCNGKGCFRLLQEVKIVKSTCH